MLFSGIEAAELILKEILYLKFFKEVMLLYDIHRYTKALPYVLFDIHVKRFWTLPKTVYLGRREFGFKIKINSRFLPIQTIGAVDQK